MDYRIDFEHSAFKYRLKKLQGKNELIAKAIGWKKGVRLQVFDATAGIGKDAFILAALGCDLTLTERHPLVVSLFLEALHHAKNDLLLAPLIERMRFFATCAIQYLKNNPDYKPDVIYCDPMFPLRQKSALVKKDLQMLQQLVGQDEDSDDLVAHSLQRAQKRVVVKRSLRAPFLHAKPSFCFKARSHRFDIYLTK